MVWTVELAKVLVGAIGVDLVMHLGLLASKEEPKMFGVRFTNRLNSIIAIGDLVAVALLAWYAWL